MKQPPLKIGLICDAGKRNWLTDYLVNESEKSEAFRVSLIIEQDLEEITSGTIVGRILRYGHAKGWTRLLEAIAFKILSRIDELVSRKKLSLLLENAPPSADYSRINHIMIKPVMSKSLNVFSYKNCDLEKIRGFDVDALVRCGSGILVGGILNLCRFGVLSFHHGDNRICRGGPAGFWEVYHRHGETGFVVQKLTDSLDGGVILYRGSCITLPTYSLNNVNVNLRSLFAMRLTIEKMYLACLSLEDNPSLYSSRLFTTPSPFEQVVFLYKIATFGCKYLWQRIFGFYAHWDIYWVASKSWRNTCLYKMTKVNSKPGVFFADPFIYEHGDETYIFVEEFRLKESKGVISCLKKVGDQFHYLGVVLEKKSHLSFPFIIQNGEDIYLLPESASDLTVDLYKCVEFPMSWQRVSSPVTGLSCADSIVFWKDPYWVLLTNVDPFNLGEHSNQLYGFRSFDLEKDDWELMSSYPLCADAGQARNAGCFSDGDDLYRVCQKHHFGFYGAGFGVSKLSINDSFDLIDEKFVEEVYPDFDTQISGAHTLSVSGSHVCIDMVTKNRGFFARLRK